MKNSIHWYVRRYGVLSLLSLAVLQLLWAQSLGYIRTEYTKYEYRIPMRDGKKLFTAVYVPKDNSRSYPIMLKRTPYGVVPYGVKNFPAYLGPSEKLTRDGFIFVLQDVRGRMMSEGEFINMTPHREAKTSSNDIDESSDTYDTIDWLVKNIPNNTGKVGMWGISYPGFYAAAGMIDAHPALKAVSPQAPIADWFVGDDFHHNGALFLAHAFEFLYIFGRPQSEPATQLGKRFDYPTPDGYDFYLKMGPLSNVNKKYYKNDIPFWNELIEHATYDSFWQSRNLSQHLKNIGPAVMTVGGWFDAEDLYGTLSVYKSVEASSSGAYNILVMGPWYHGGWAFTDGSALGSVRFDSDTAVFYREQIEFPFFKHFLKGDEDLNLPEAYVFETGKNQWQRKDAWPPKEVKSKNLYFRANGKLSWNPPADDTAALFDQYISDPAKPVPYINGFATNMTREYMVEDQRFASRRTDVLVYETEVLSRDIVVAGPVIASLHVSTTGTDSVFVVKLIDVYPDDTPDYEPYAEGIRMGGFQQLVRGEVFRGKFRNSYEHPEAFVPGKVTKIQFEMPDIFHTFQRGHRIMIHVQSSWFPLVDRNPQQFLDIYHAKASDFQKATQQVYRSKSSPSFITLYVLDNGK